MEKTEISKWCTATGRMVHIHITYDHRGNVLRYEPKFVK